MATDGNLEDQLGQVGSVTPPKRDERKSSGNKSQTVKELKPQLEKFFREVLAPAVSIADEYDGRIIEKKASQLATAYATLAGESPAIKRAIVFLLSSGGPLSAAVFVTASTALPILHHHGVIQLPPQMGIILIGEELPEPPPPPVHDERENGSSGDTADAESFARIHPPVS